MAQTETRRDLHADRDCAVEHLTPPGAVVHDAQFRQDGAYRSGFFRGAVIGVIASIPLWVLIALGAIWLLR